MNVQRKNCIKICLKMHELQVFASHDAVQFSREEKPNMHQFWNSTKARQVALLDHNCDKEFLAMLHTILAITSFCNRLYFGTERIFI